MSGRGLSWALPLSPIPCGAQHPLPWQWRGWGGLGCTLTHPVSPQGVLGKPGIPGVAGADGPPVSTGAWGQGRAERVSPCKGQIQAPPAPCIPVHMHGCMHAHANVHRPMPAQLVCPCVAVHANMPKHRQVLHVCLHTPMFVYAYTHTPMRALSPALDHLHQEPGERTGLG